MSPQPSPEPPTDDRPLNQSLPGLPGLIGIRLTSLAADRVEATLTVTNSHLVPGAGHLHAAAVVALADTACGYGCRAALPAGATGFTTLALNSNHLGTAHPGQHLTCTATPAHVGRSTQVWDATITTDTGPRPIALFRCTQLVLYPLTAPGPTTVTA